MTTRTTTRRTLLTGAAAPTVAAHSAVADEIGHDTRLVELGRILDAKRLEIVAMENETGKDIAHEEAYDALSEIEVEITNTPATTIAGLRVKARAILLDPELQERNERGAELDALDFEALLWRLAKDVLAVIEQQATPQNVTPA